MRSGAVILALSLMAGPVLARELPAFHQGVRPLGMGGAFTAVSDDANAVFYNPAGLDKVERWNIGIVNPLVEVNKNAIDFYKDYRDTDVNDTVAVIRLLQDHGGDYVHARAALYPNFTMRHFAAGVLGQATVNAQPNNAVPELDVGVFGSVSGHAGVGYGFFDGMLKVGGAAKFVRAERLEQIYTAADIAANGLEDRVRGDLKEGSGFGVDVGAMVEFPSMLKPTLALAVQNIGDVSLGEAGDIPQQVNVGASLSYSPSSWLTLVGAADWVDVTKNVGNDSDTYKRLHVGAEARVRQLLAVRAGLYQGYASFGVGLDLWALKLDYATYAEELGTGAGVRADRRHALQVSFGW